MKGKHRSWGPALYDINGALDNACRGSISCNYEPEQDSIFAMGRNNMIESESPPTLQEIEGKTTIHKSSTLLQKYFAIFQYRLRLAINILFLRLKKINKMVVISFRNNTEGDKQEAEALKIDFWKDCFTNYSSTSVICPFCEIGLVCEQSKRELIKSVSISSEKAEPYISITNERKRGDLF